MPGRDTNSESAGRIDAGFVFRAVRSLMVTIVFLAVVLFLPGGEIRWWNGWFFLAVFLALTIVSVVYLRLRNPEIFVARSRIQAGTKAWDKVILVFLLGSLLAIFPVAGFDHRYHWSSVPVWLIALGYVLFSLGFAGSIWVYAVNKYAEPGVRIQSDRGQKVIDTGPYAIVRHPLYLFSLILVIATPLALGSFWALIPVAAGTLAIVVRTAWEDRLLQEELEGYTDYAARVRYRLIPGVW